ncbi:MAG: hypothetical protein ACKPKO_08380 [Candidatus Fonsibacter sp.]
MIKWERRGKTDEREREQERQERAKSVRIAGQIIRNREYQRHYYQNQAKKPVECERRKRFYASVYSMRRHYCCVRGKV